jgi:hypothetical protein
MTTTAIKLDIAMTWDQLRKDWASRLSRHGVPDIGTLNNPPGCMQLQLVYLRHFLGAPVNKHDMATWIQGCNNKCGLDPQARHWKSRGWDVQGQGGVDARNNPLPNSYYCLTTLGPSADFLTKRTRELGRIAATDWDSLKLAYNHRCAICGCNGVELEQGHMDPRDELQLNNTVPLCTKCNRWQLDRFVINEEGRITTILPVESNRALFKGLDARERRQLQNLLS